MALTYSNVKTLKAIRGVRQAVVDIALDSSYDNGGWSIAASAITAAAGGILNRIFNLLPGGAGGYQFEWVPVAGNASGKLKALVGSAKQKVTVDALAEYTMVPANTATEQIAAYAVAYDASVTGVSAYSLLSVTAAAAGYTANYQLFPDTPAAGDAVFFGGAVPFPQLGIDMSATVTVYDAAGVVGWDYWNGSAWSDLDASIIYDGSGTTGNTGDYFAEGDGVLTFVPPQDWAASTVNGQSAYWVRASIETGKGANMTTVGLTNSTEHDILIPDTGYVPVRNGVLGSLHLIDSSDVAHTANDIEFIVWNSTTGDSSGVVAFPQDEIDVELQLTNPVPVSIGDKLAIVCTQEDGTNELDSGFWTFQYQNAEALADDGGLAGVSVRALVIGS
jgi:hypothetical protein